MAAEKYLAEKVQADASGFCPVLTAGQYCKDAEGLWHFCTPDGTHFAVGGRSKLPVQVIYDKRGISIVHGFITHACCQTSGDTENKWTVVNGRWEKRK